MISIIDENSLIDDFRDLNFDGSNADDIYDFATASSEFYPQLAASLARSPEDPRLGKKNHHSRILPNYSKLSESLHDDMYQFGERYGDKLKTHLHLKDMNPIK